MNFILLILLVLTTLQTVESASLGMLEPSCLNPSPTIPKLILEKDKSIFEFDRVISFGDSLNDNGALFKKTLGLYPDIGHYCKGRFSNGMVWIEYLTNMLSNHLQSTLELKDFSVGGSSTSSSLQAISPLLTSLEQQIGSQFQSYKEGKQFENSLFSIWFGGNDYLLTSVTPEQVVTKLESLIKEYLLPLNLNTLILGDLPPLNRPLGTYDEQEKLRRIELTFQHNQLFEAMLLRLQYTIQQNGWNTKLVPFKTADLLDPLIQGAYDPNFFEGPLIVDKPCSSQKLFKNICTNPETYLFWDNNHPTTSVHRYLAHTISQRIQV